MTAQIVDSLINSFVLVFGGVVFLALSKRIGPELERLIRVFGLIFISLGAVGFVLSGR
jgi:uncharacterized membrane protein YqgA involved in biofilm formation